MDLYGLALDAFIAASAAWIWARCAQPSLSRRRNSIRAQQVAFATTVAVIVAYATGFAARVAQVNVPGLWWATTIIGGIWIVVVGLGVLQDFRLLLHVTGSNRRHPN